MAFLVKTQAIRYQTAHTHRNTTKKSPVIWVTGSVRYFNGILIGFIEAVTTCTTQRKKHQTQWLFGIKDYSLVYFGQLCYPLTKSDVNAFMDGTFFLKTWRLVFQFEWFGMPFFPQVVEFLKDSI